MLKLKMRSNLEIFVPQRSQDELIRVKFGMEECTIAWSTITRQIWRLLGQEEWVHEPTKFKICGQICGFRTEGTTVYTD